MNVRIRASGFKTRLRNAIFNIGKKTIRLIFNHLSGGYRYRVLFQFEVDIKKVCPFCPLLLQIINVVLYCFFQASTWAPIS